MFIKLENYILSFKELLNSSELILLKIFQEICFIIFSFKLSSVTHNLIRLVIQVLPVQILFITGIFNLANIINLIRTNVTIY